MRIEHIMLSYTLHVLALVACTPEPKPPTVEVDASTVVVVDAAPSACASACANLRRLGCPEGETADGGKSCVDLCDQLQASGKFDMKPACVAAAQTREELAACKTARCK